MTTEGENTVKIDELDRYRKPFNLNGDSLFLIYLVIVF